MSRQRFAFHHDPRFAIPLRLLGVRPQTSWVVLDEHELRIRFGHWRLTTPLTNIATVTRTGPYRWFKAVGPRLSLADGGVTFGTSARGGICIQFHEPVGALFGDRLRHPGVTVTVAGPQTVLAAVRARIGTQSEDGPS